MLTMHGIRIMPGQSTCLAEIVNLIAGEGDRAQAADDKRKAKHQTEIVMSIDRERR